MLGKMCLNEPTNSRRIFQKVTLALNKFNLDAAIKAMRKENGIIHYKIPHFVLMALLSVLPVVANTRITSEGSAAGRLASVISRHIHRSDGQWPTNWSQLSDELVEPNEWLASADKDSIQATYVFVAQDFPTNDFLMGKIIVAQYRPTKDTGIKGRYVVIHESSAYCHWEWVSERDFQALLAAYGRDLPPPSPEYLHFRFSRSLAAVTVLAMVAVAFCLWRFLKTRSCLVNG